MDARLLTAIALALVAGCAKPLVPGPVVGKHPDAALWDQPQLPEPPPSVEAEEVPKRPSTAHVWIDGQWEYSPLTKRWTWAQGAWCKPPEGARHYARAEVQRYRAPAAEQPRITRWNEAQKRYEEVDSGDDVFRWRKGRFYVAGKDGALAPWTGAVECVGTTSR